jgi:hypothetical protein
LPSYSKICTMWFNPSIFRTLESEGQLMKQCWIKYIFVPYRCADLLEIFVHEWTCICNLFVCFIVSLFHSAFFVCRLLLYADTTSQLCQSR